MENRRDEPRHIADHSAPQPNDERLSIQPRRDHLIANRAGLLERLRFLA